MAQQLFEDHWTFSEGFLENLRTLLDKEFDATVRDAVLADDGDGVTIYFKSNSADVIDDLGRTQFVSPLTVMFQVDLGIDNMETGDPVREINLEGLIDYELDEVHVDNLVLYESLAAEMERLAVYARTRVEEVKRLLGLTA